MDKTEQVFCPVCKLKNEASATICEHCQSPIPQQKSRPRTTKRVPEITQLFDTDELIENASIPTEGMSILSQETGQEIATVQEQKFILGRAIEGVQETIIDLSAYGAYGLGVSRLHALIQKTATGYEISDMDSTNGTWLNEKDLVSNKFYPLKNGDSIRLGKMYLIVLFDKRPG